MTLESTLDVGIFVDEFDNSFEAHETALASFDEIHDSFVVFTSTFFGLLFNVLHDHLSQLHDSEDK